MARRSSVEPCMICAEMPCVCGKKPAKVRAVRAAKPVVELPTDAPASTADRWTQAAVSRPASAPCAPIMPEPTPEPIRVASAPVRPVEELLFDEAIRALEPLLAESSKSEFRMTLSGRLTPAEQLAVWKARRVLG